MSASVPNLRPHVRPDADGAQCGGHCDHVGFMWRDMKRMEKAFWFLFAAIIALLVKDVLPGMLNKRREYVPMVHDGELLAPDRVAEPATKNSRGVDEQ